MDPHEAPSPSISRGRVFESGAPGDGETGEMDSQVPLMNEFSMVNVPHSDFEIPPPEGEVPPAILETQPIGKEQYVFHFIHSLTYYMIFFLFVSSYVGIRRYEGNRIQRELTAEAKEWLERLPTVPRINETRSIFITGFRRSGSSITARILSSHPSAIYFFEPLMSFMDINDEVPFDGDVLKRLIHCKFQGTIPRLSVYRFLASFPLGIFPYKEFLYGMKMEAMNPLQFSRMARNEAFMEQHCSRHSIRVIKEVERFPLHKLAPLLKEVEDMRVVHLWRDPLSIWKSRLDEYWCCGSCRNLTHVCSVVSKELREGSDFSKAFPGRYVELHYEDIVERPVETIAAVYSRLGIPWHQSVEDFVKKQAKKKKKTSTPSVDIPPICITVRKELKRRRLNASMMKHSRDSVRIS
ncbi:unnamed protein product [Darwinula stevensoni]|uniref:Sulfotransferase n=1 Tax=Darwinula stevensoni TaxID=69355 RepID=A0A7R9AAC2_9CRUS|nr:unnamed protein product [Darwinula stevensoni]CAG0898306.1 unnamed protein product [Darwinula stevensoni]